MSDQWNPWKMTILGLLLMGATSLVTTLVLGYRSENTSHAGTGIYSSSSSSRKFLTTNPIDVNACNAYAEQRAMGSAAGRVQGVDETRSHNDAYQTAYRTCMRQKGY